MKKVGICGAGLAGLTAAYRLTLKGVQCDIYEASSRIGGRAWSERFPEGKQVYELGGEFIDTDHISIRSLCEELSIPLVEALPRGGEEIYIVRDENGNPVKYTQSEAFEDYKKVFPLVQADAYASWPSNQDFNPNNKKAQELDRLSVDEYVNRVCSILSPGELDGRNSKYAQVLKLSYLTEYGEEVTKQSALNLILLLGFGDINTFGWYGYSDEKYNIQGGTQRLANVLLSRIQLTGLARVFTSSPITKVTRYPGIDAMYELKSTKNTGIYNAILMTNSYESYSNFDYSQAGFSAEKLCVIRTLKLGNSSKLNMQFQSVNGLAPWSGSGSSFANSYQSTWDVTQDQDTSKNCVLCNFTGGDYALTFKTDSTMGSNKISYLKEVTDDFLNKVELTYPGLKNYFKLASDGSNVSTINWAENKWTMGAYTCFYVGQYAGGTGTLNSDGTVSPSGAVYPVATKESTPEPQSLPMSSRNCFFAGEACNVEFQGWLNGAVYTAEEAAKGIIKYLKV